MKYSVEDPGDFQARMEARERAAHARWERELLEQVFVDEIDGLDVARDREAFLEKLRGGE